MQCFSSQSVASENKYIGRASEMYNRLVNQFKEQQGITEQLKAEDMMAWVQAMNNIANQAREVVYNEVINNA